MLPKVYFYVWFHFRYIIALVCNNPYFISHWISIESWFVYKNKISWFLIKVIICKFNILLFFINRLLLKLWVFHTWYWWLNQTQNNYRSLYYKYGDIWQHVYSVMNLNKGGIWKPTIYNSHFHNDAGSNG